MIKKWAHKLRNLNLGRKFLLSFSAIVIVLLSITLGVVEHFTKAAVIEKVERDLSQAKSVLVTFNSTQLDNLFLIARAVADAPIMKSLMGVEDIDHETMLQTLEELSSTVSSDHLGVVDADGVLLARTDKPEEYDFDYSERPDIAAAIAAEPAPFIWAQSEEEDLLQVVSVPIQMEERPIGALSVGLKITNETAQKFVDMTGAGMAVIADDKVKAYHGVPKEVFESILSQGLFDKEHSTPVLFTVNGERFYAIVENMDENSERFHHVLVTSLDKALEFFQKIQIMMLSVGLLGLIGSGFMTSKASKSLIVTPITKILSATELVRKGDLSGRIPVTSQDEIGILSTNFNFMMDDLKKSREEVENYAKNLEGMVNERTSELNSANGTISAMINSLGQGFMVIEPGGKINPIYSKACESLIEAVPAGKHVWDVVPHPGKEPEKLWTALFMETLPFEDLVGLCPATFKHSQDRHITLSYNAIRGEDQSIESIVLVATDRTSEVQAMQAAERERNYANMVVRISKNKKQFAVFTKLSKDLLTETLAEGQKENPDFDLLFRLVHTIKGGSASFSIISVKDLAHSTESYLYGLKRGECEDPAAALAKVRAQSLEMADAFEAFLSENRNLIGTDSGADSVQIPMVKLKNFSEKLAALPEGASWQATFEEEFILEPIKDGFSHFDDMVEPVKERLGKEVNPISFINGDIKVKAENYTDLIGSMIHAIRNALDHGLESPEDREAAGKPRLGNLTFEFVKEKVEKKDWLTVKFSDDGKGIDPANIRAKLIKLGREEEANKLSDDEAIQMVFDAGFSTKDEVTETSGRGVGLDAIAYEAQKLGGFARIFTRLGEGTTLVVSVPTSEGRVQVQDQKTAN
jgi:two-component system chemotaxis sensor kinase CheA